MSQFNLLGVPVKVYPSVATIGVTTGLLTYALARWRKLPQPELLALASGVTVYGAELSHVAGHIVSSELSGAPMDRVEWWIYAQSGYDQHDVTPWQHIGRSVGGPIASTLLALVLLALSRALGANFAGRLAHSAALQNLLLGVGGLAPLPIIDGGVILANVRKLRQ